jgi:hypothetical protein
VTRNATWMGDDPEDMHRYRPSPSKLHRQISRAQRRAEIVCHGAGARPALIAIIYPRNAPADRLAVLTWEGRSTLGRDLEVWCRCGVTHRLDGGRLRGAVLATNGTGTRTPTIDVRRVEADPDGSQRIE